MNEQQHLWGLSNGVIVFAIAGAFWLGLGIGSYANKIGGLACALLTVLQVGIGAALLWAAARLRRKSGFRRADLRQELGRRSPETRHILAGFRWTVAGQIVLIGFAVWLCVRAGAEQQIWPAIALIVSLHLIPLGMIFHVRAYYATAAAGCVVSIMTITVLTGPYAVAFLSAGMAIVMWISSIHLLWNADTIAARALGERWAA